MAIEKMKLVNIVGLKPDFDRVVADYVLGCDIHLESVISALDNIKGLQPYEDNNPYESIFQRASAILQSQGLALPNDLYDDGKVLSVEQMENSLEEINSRIAQYNGKKAELEREIAENRMVIGQLRPLLNIDGVSIDSFFHFRFVKFRFGRMPKRSLKTLDDYLYDITAFFIPTYEEKEEVWGMYFMPASLEDKIDAIFNSLYFQRTRISDKAVGHPKQASMTLEKQIAEHNAAIAEIEKQKREFILQRQDTLRDIYTVSKKFNRVHEVKQQAAHTKESFYIVGWMPEQQAHSLEIGLEGEGTVVTLAEQPKSVPKITPPTKLRNNFLVKPFEMFVRMYGMPSYHEMDPSVLVAITYVLMFGIMFGDLGQGVILTLAGLIFAKLKKSDLGAIIARVGISSMVFGLVYGSVFGHEDIVHGIIRPMERMNFVLLAAVGLGVFLILTVMVINIVNSLKNKDIKLAIFGQNGIAGLILYASAVCIAIFSYTKMGPRVEIWIIIAFIVVPLISIFLQEPLAALVEKNREKKHQYSGMFFLEAFFELFEILLSFITNTMSFIRVGAFALNHVGMMSVVFVLADMAGDGIGSIVTQVFGNILVIGLEGLIVGIQVLRLEYYELFSRFFIGDGREFKKISE